VPLSLAIVSENRHHARVNFRDSPTQIVAPSWVVSVGRGPNPRMETASRFTGGSGLMWWGHVFTALFAPPTKRWHVAVYAWDGVASPPAMYVGSAWPRVIDRSRPPLRLWRFRRREDATAWADQVRNDLTSTGSLTTKRPA
jgi:hypothetical protein